MDSRESIHLADSYYMNTFSRFPIVFEYGKGCTLYDAEDKAYTDFLAGIAVNTLGYDHPALQEPLKNSVIILHCSNLILY